MTKLKDGEITETSPDKKLESLITWLTYTLGIAVFGGLLAAWLFWVKIGGGKLFSLSSKIDQWGQTGDFFGGILNPFFTLIGLFFVIISITQNQRLLHQSEKELLLSRKELEKSNEALQSQLVTAELQRFENTFFQLLSLCNDTANNLKLDGLTGKQCISHLYVNDLFPIIKGDKNFNIQSCYDLFRRKYGYLLDNYFYNLDNCITFVDNSNLSIEEKIFYVNLVSSQLSLYELSLLFYFCLLPIEYKQNTLSNLVKKYPILRNLDKKSLANEAHSELLEYAKD